MAELREIPLPPHLKQMVEMRLIDEISDNMISKLMDEVEDRLDDILIMDATEIGISRREKIIGYTPYDGEPLETRRLRVLNKWYDRSPYTRIVIERKLTAMCGEGNYTLHYDPDNCEMLLVLHDLDWDIVDGVIEFLEDAIMLNIIMVVKNEVIVEDKQLLSYAHIPVIKEQISVGNRVKHKVTTNLKYAVGNVRGFSEQINVGRQIEVNV